MDQCKVKKKTGRGTYDFILAMMTDKMGLTQDRVYNGVVN